MPDDAIPATGRDVQCSDCGQTWFARPENPSDKAVGETPRPRPAPKAPPRPYPPQERDPLPPRQELDASVKDILQQEVDREVAARKADANAALERQQDLGLDDLPATAPATSATEIEERAPAEKSKDSLPDVDDLDTDMDEALSGLQPREKEIPAEDPTKLKRRNRFGFQFGFWVAIAILILAFFIYKDAPIIQKNIPATTDYLNSYVSWVDGLRSWLSEKASDAQTWLDAQMGGGA